MKHPTTIPYALFAVLLMMFSGLLTPSSSPAFAGSSRSNQQVPPPLPPFHPQGRHCTSVRLGSQATPTAFDETTLDTVRKDAPSVVSDHNGMIYVAWVDNRQSQLNIYFARSSDGGRTWSEDVRVNDGRTPLVSPTTTTYPKQYDMPRLAMEGNRGGVDFYASPSLAVDSQGRLYLTWVDVRDGHADIYFARSNDKGATWSRNQRINDDTGNAGQYDPSIAVSQSATGQPQVYIVWEDYRDGYPDVYLARSDYGGVTWGANSRVNPQPGMAENPSIAVDAQGSVYCVWCQEILPTGPGEGGWNIDREQHDIHFARSDDSGVTWTAHSILNDGQQGSAETPRILIDAVQNVYVVWQDSRWGAMDIFFTHSGDSGATWSANTRISDGETSNQLIPDITADISGTIYVAWEDQRNGLPDIYAVASTDYGRTWGRNFRVNDDEGDSIQNYPSLASHISGMVYLAWKDTRNGGSEVYFATSTDRGKSWSTNETVNTKGQVKDGQFRVMLPLVLSSAR